MFAIIASAVIVLAVLAFASGSLRYIANNRIAIVEKLWSPKGSVQRGLIALNGEAGYQPEIAYYEVLHELKLIVDLFYEGGITRMLEFVSETAQYGDFVSGPRVIDGDTKRRMQAILADIRSGEFTQRWVAEHASGLPNYRRLRQADLEHPIEAVGQRLRAKMAWLAGDATAAVPVAAANTQPSVMETCA